MSILILHCIETYQTFHPSFYLGLFYKHYKIRDDLWGNSRYLSALRWFAYPGIHLWFGFHNTRNLLEINCNKVLKMCFYKRNKRSPFFFFFFL